MSAAPPPPRLLTDRVDYWAAIKPDAEAIRYGPRSWTWSQWQDRIRRVSGALLAAGIKHGDRVAFVDKNHPACLEVTLGASAIGAANAIVNWRLGPDELTYVIEDSGARVLFVGAELAGGIAAVRDRLSGVEQVVLVGGDANGYEELLSGAEPTGAQPGVGIDDTAFLIYTSGTTGFPKGAMLTHRGVNAHSASVRTVFPFTDADHTLVAMPLFHVGGTCYALIGIHGGARTTITREPDAPSLFGAIAGGATHAFLVPAVIAGILAAGDQAIAAFSSLAWLGYGASPCPAPVLRQALAVWPNTNLIQVYGMTELAGVVCTLSPEAHRDASRPERLLSAGTPLAGVELRVVDPVTGDDVAQGAAGELWFRTEQRMAGYSGNPDATAETITSDGWLKSGDIGQVDDGGFVFIVDRVKDMIITGGENVYSPEVEQVIAEYPGVAEVAIIGVPDPRWGESIKAVVAAAPGTSIDPDKVIEFCRERLAHYKCPRSVDIVDALPRNATGKILKRTLRRPYWQDQARNVS
jgi:acyl-CoA synthetase (AMP-forming)/AMP-acid ligase II